MTDKPKSRRGFASMSPERHREISATGGRSVPGEKRAFAKDPTLASDAGKIGKKSRALKAKPNAPR